MLITFKEKPQCVVVTGVLGDRKFNQLFRYLGRVRRHSLYRMTSVVLVLLQGQVDYVGMYLTDLCKRRPDSVVSTGQTNGGTIWRM